MRLCHHVHAVCINELFDVNMNVCKLVYAAFRWTRTCIWIHVSRCMYEYIHISDICVLSYTRYACACVSVFVYVRKSARVPV